MDWNLWNKYEKLKEYIATLESVAVAFSSGVDSTFLLYAAKEALGGRAVAVTASADSFPVRELNEAKEYCGKLGVKHYMLPLDQFKIEGFANNPKNRCYLCKKGIFQEIIKLTKEQGINQVIEGSNMDDMGDYRPGLMAIDELGIKSPLRDTGFYKHEIRELSKELGLPTWDKPSLACLASRFPYGHTISKDKLRMVDQAEQLLLELGFKQLRVRIHEDVARIELETKDFDTFMKEDIRNQVYKKFNEYGFAYVALDIRGYRTGSMNESL